VTAGDEATTGSNSTPKGEEQRLATRIVDSSKEDWNEINAYITTAREMLIDENLIAENEEITVRKLGEVLMQVNLEPQDNVAKRNAESRSNINIAIAHLLKYGALATFDQDMEGLMEARVKKMADRCDVQLQVATAELREAVETVKEKVESIEWQAQRGASGGIEAEFPTPNEAYGHITIPGRTQAQQRRRYRCRRPRSRQR
jgi:hypothetical protein